MFWGFRGHREAVEDLWVGKCKDSLKCDEGDEGGEVEVRTEKRTDILDDSEVEGGSAEQEA